MAAETDTIYKDRDEIVTELAASLQGRIPDINLGEDSVVRIWIETLAQTVEGLFLANQLLHNDMFPQTASALALERMGEYWGRPRLGGTLASGTLRFAGVGGTTIPQGTLAAAPGTSDETLRFATSAVAVIPSPGVPTAPVASDGGAAGNLSAATYEWAVTFTTAIGETAIGAASNALALAVSHKGSLASVPLGGTGTVARKIYRRKNGGAWGYVATIGDNTTTTYLDNIADGSVVGTPPVDSTAEQIDVTATAEDAGAEYNVLANSITDIAEAVSGVVSVVNTVAFTGGTDEEDIETFRSELIDFMRSPKSGSKADLEVWAESVPGVETATAFENDNLGTPTNGHATVRITGPGGTAPSPDVEVAVLAELSSHDVANVTLHVGNFTAIAIDVSVTLTLDPAYLLADVSDSVAAAVRNYIVSVPIGGTVYALGILSAVFGLPGVKTATTTFTDTTTTSTQKATPGVITVS